MRVLLCLSIVAQCLSGRSNNFKYTSKFKEQYFPLQAKSHDESLQVTYESVSESANYILEKTSHRPKIGIICGSGLAVLADLVQNKDTFEYMDIPNFPLSTVQGHESRLVIGTVKGIAVMMMLGKFFVYEGYSAAISAMPVRVMKMIGVEILIVTNAAGGLNQKYKVGDIMVLKDHINWPGFSGVNPLRGPNEKRFGERFIAVNNAYNHHWRQLAKSVSKKLKTKVKFHEGVYAMIGGPNYETVAELKMFLMCGVDAVGMSTVPEVLVARQSNMSVFAYSFISNMCIIDENAEIEPHHNEVLEEARKTQEVLLNYTTQIILGMAKTLKKVSN